MVTPKRIRLSRAKGWRLPLNAKSVARPHAWGNGYRVEKSDLLPGLWEVTDQCEVFGSFISKAEAIEQAVALHNEWLLEELQVNPILVEAFAELRGLDLGCWCDLSNPCHADNLLREANR